MECKIALFTAEAFTLISYTRASKRETTSHGARPALLPVGTGRAVLDRSGASGAAEPQRAPRDGDPAAGLQ